MPNLVERTHNRLAKATAANPESKPRQATQNQAENG